MQDYKLLNWSELYGALASNTVLNFIIITANKSIVVVPYTCDLLHAMPDPAYLVPKSPNAIYAPNAAGISAYVEVPLHWLDHKLTNVPSKPAIIELLESNILIYCCR